MCRRRGRGRAPAPAAGRDSGAVTAELVVALPALVLLLTLAIGVVMAVTWQLRCADAAQVAARLAARSEPAAVVQAAARRVAPTGANVSVGTDAAGDLTVTVSAPLRIPGWGHALPAFTARAVFTEAKEPEG